MSKTEVLIVSKGHAYNHDAFLAMFDECDDISTTLVEQPAAQIILQPQHAEKYDAVLFYDMSGIPGVGLTHDESDGNGQPTDAYRGAIESLIETGKGIVLLNHGTVSWPNWPLWREIHGSSFLLSSGEVFGENLPGSGYRGGHGPHPNPTFTLSPVDITHPVIKGIESGFSIADEIYIKSDNFEKNVLPLMRSDYSYSSENFTAPPLAPPEEQENWNHPAGSNLVVWANAAGNSPVIASDIGDSPEAFSNKGFRTLLSNSLRWVSSDEGRSWAKEFRKD